ncbi:hypothetical protein PMIN06_008471 [Paraphaeosphaeria minitans]|uniref:Uncharacterized protein n=1 Tax=Paraphaeosphaeria minitans TaxID=565426 RepID=A0A9P6GSP8_9PLEO|nr:hypothetical protein PMIN01_03050 [Paraphaeosphaeria minitans]
MRSNTPASELALLEKCALHEEARISEVSVDKANETCGNEDEAPRPTKIISGWGLAWGWLLSWCMAINFLHLGVETPSSIVPTVRQSNPPVPVIDSTYFIVFCLVMNFYNGIDELVRQIKKDREIAPSLLLSALSAACFSSAAGATALEVLMVFIPAGINAGFTAIYFISCPKVYEPEKTSEKTSEKTLEKTSEMV